MHTFGTLFDIRYLARGLALYHSLFRNARPFELWVLCLDDATHAALEQLALEHLKLVPLAELEAADPALLDIKGSRTLTEYYFTLTPAWTSFVLARTEADAWAAYVDADMIFYSSPEPIFDELAEASVGIVPHRFPKRDRHMERFGRYNVGMVALRNDETGRAVLKDWRERCLEWCYDHVDETGDRFADQKYLDAWPKSFPRVHEIAHPGAGVAPWNWMTMPIDVSHESPRIGNAPLIFYHFHRFRFVGASGFASGLAATSRMPARVFERLYREYAQELVARSHQAGVPVLRDPFWTPGSGVAGLRRSARLLWGMLPGNSAFGTR